MEARWPLLLLSVLVPVGGTLAQRTHIVGPGGFRQITGAIAVASSGDTILVHTGTYDHFQLDKGLTIRAAPQARVHVYRQRGAGQNLFSVPNGQWAEIVGLRFETDLPVFNLFNRYVTRVVSGRVAFRECRFVSSGVSVPGNPALEVEGGDVVLRDCEVIGALGGPGLSITRSCVAATRTTVLGGPGFWDSYAYGGTGIVLRDGRLHACRIDVTGGAVPIFNPFYDGGHGIHLLGARSRLWIADGAARGGAGGSQPGNRGGDGIRNESGWPVRALRTTAFGGPGNVPGLAVRGPWHASAPLLSIQASAGPALGSRFDVDFVAVARTPVAVLASPRFAAIDTALLAQPLWVDPASLQIVGAGTGSFRASFAIPSTPVLRGATLWVSGIAVAGLPFDTSPPVGGQVW